MKFYKRDPDRALAGMAELTLKQRGAYNSLLDLLYSRDGNVPDDDARVSRMISCHWREWATIKAELIAIGKVWVEDGNLRARRVQETIKEASDFGQEQSRRASKKWAKSENIKENNEAVMPAGNANIATPTPTEVTSLRSVAAAPKRAKGTRLPDDWSLPNEWGKWAQDDLGLDAKFIRQQTAVFRDYWIAKAGANATKLDWQATWRNWMRKAAQDRSRDRGGSARQPSMLELNAQLLAEMEDADARRQADRPSLEPPAGHLPDIRKR